MPSLALRLMTRLASHLERDVAETEARAAAGKDVRADVARLERRTHRAQRLVDFLGRRAD